MYKKNKLVQQIANLDVHKELDLILKDLSLITTEAQITLEREPLPMSKVTGKVIDDLEEQMKRGTKLMGLTTGWQMLDKYIGGWNKGNLIIIAGRPGCFDGEQLIHTKRGLTKIKDINTTDSVLSYNEKKDINEWRKVLARPLHETTPDKMYKITLKDGTVIKVTENHEFFTGSTYMKIKDFILPLLHGKDLENN
jgi:replicative DNA helicase